MEELKQALVIRNDLGLSEGKKIAQACHACLGAFRNSSDSLSGKWLAQGGKKAVLKVEGEKALTELYKEAEKSGLPAHLVKDAGRTEIEPGTKTCIGIGPGIEAKIDEITGHLKLL
ncbi:MAG: peptidyl-tRNA hydrolase Pth2 [Candidatus Nanohaloarchaea archaeon]|nr:peptidyl-tRNA hydrolase Pth2 [Candidatus Nanohaloarchaea archaeon]